MSYKYVVSNDRPIHYYLLEATSGTTIIDYVTNASGGTWSAFPGSPTPISNNAVNSKELSTQTGTLNAFTDFWNSDCSTTPFSVEFIFYPNRLSGKSTILGTSTDGIYTDNNYLYFTVTGENGPTTVIAPLPLQMQNMHVVCVYDVDNLHIYIDGELMATTVNLNETITQPATSQFVINRAPQGVTFALSQLAFYKRVLIADIIQDHVEAAFNNRFVDNFTKDANVYFDLDDESAEVVLDDYVEGLDLLEAYDLDNLIASDFGVQTDDVTIVASRTAFYALAPYEIIDGSRINWDSTSADVTVDVSLDGGTIWATNIANNDEIPGLTRNTDVSNVALLIRHNFAIQTDPVVPYLNSVHVVIYGNKNPKSTDGSIMPILVGSATLIEELVDPIKVKTDALSFGIGGALQIPAPPSNIYAIEFFFRPTAINIFSTVIDARTTSGGSELNFSLNTSPTNPTLAGGSFYLNGVLNNSPLRGNFLAGKWYHMFFIPNTPISTPIFINSRYDGQNAVGNRYQRIGLYYNAPLDAATILKHYQSAFGIPFFSVTEATTIGVSETQSVVYNNNWGVSVG